MAERDRGEFSNPEVPESPLIFKFKGFDVGPIANLETFDMRNGDLSDAKSLLVQQTIPPMFHWQMIQGLPPKQSFKHVDTYIQMVYAQIMTNKPADTTDSVARKLAIVVGTARAVTTELYDITEGHILVGEMAPAVLKATEETNQGYQIEVVPGTDENVAKLLSANLELDVKDVGKTVGSREKTEQGRKEEAGCLHGEKREERGKAAAGSPARGGRSRGDPVTNFILLGCDASILLNHVGSERRAKESKTLRGFNVIDDIKKEIEKKCPKTVSCADILTAASREATVKIGGPFWEVPYGRKDGRVSLASEAALVPMGHENVTYLIEFFQSKDLSLLDLVVLSGSHTIGRSTCGSIQDRLYNFKGTGKPDPSIDARYLNFLRRKCRWASEYVELDGTTPKKFDSVYYRNLQRKMGLLSTDQLLNSDSRTSPIVSALGSQPLLFHQQFSVSMTKLGNVQVLTGDEGEIRTKCNLLKRH